MTEFAADHTVSKGKEQVAQQGSEDVMEEFALKRVPDHYRSTKASLSAMFGVPMCMYYLAVGSLSVALAGFWMGLLATLLAYGVFIIFTSTFGYVSWKGGYSFDMITRFSWGKMGSFLPSLLGTYLLMSFWAMETYWIAVALQTVWPGIHIWVFYIILFPVFVLIPLYGYRAMAKFNYIAIPVGVLATIYAFIYFYGIREFEVTGIVEMTRKPMIPGGFGVALDWSLAAVGLWALVAGDFGRFIQREHKGWARGFGPLMGGLCHILFPIAGIFIVFPMIAELTPKIGAQQAGMAAISASVPFVIAMGLLGALVVVTYQLHVQFINVYLPSVNLANFFSVIFKIEPGRKWWVVLVNLAGLGLLAIGIINWITQWAWVAGLTLGTACIISISDMAYRSYRKMKTDYDELPANMREVNPIAFVVFVIAVAVGVMDKLWWHVSPSPSVIAYPLAFVLYWIISVAAGGKYQHDVAA
jgi:purine-cytosine permease-like protein